MSRYSIVSPDNPPRDPRVDDFDAFYESWYPRAVQIATARGLTDPEAAAQECMLVCWDKDYLQRQPLQNRYSFDQYVSNLVYRRLISIQRKELRRKTIAPSETLGEREFRVGSGIEVIGEALPDWFGDSAWSDFKRRLYEIDAIMKAYYPEWYWLWKNIAMQVLLGETVKDSVDWKDFSSRVGLSQDQLEAALVEFLDVVSRDHDLADLLDVDRAPVSG